MTNVVTGILDNGTWSASFGLSLRDLTLFDVLGPQNIVRQGGGDLRKVSGAGGIASARNEIAASFLAKPDAEWLWFIDTDMSFAPDTVARLLASADPVERPVVGGLCFALRGQGFGDLYAERYLLQPTLYDWVQTDEEIGFRAVVDYPLDKLVPVAGTGAACLLIHRSVLERIRAKSGDEWFTPIVHPTGDHGKPRGFSEDLSFCIRVAGVDMPLHVDTGVKTAHHKGGIFLDEETFARQQAFSAFEKQLAEGTADGESGLRDAG